MCIRDSQKTGQTDDDAAASVANDDDKNEVGSTRNKSIGKLILEFLGIGVCGVLSNICFSTGHKIWGVWFGFGAVASFLAALATAISIKYPPKKTWFAYWIVIASAAVIFLFLSFNLLNSKNEPSIADLGRGITNLETMVSKVTNPPPSVIFVSQPPITVEPLDFRQKHEEVYLLLGGMTIFLPPVPDGNSATADIGRSDLGFGPEKYGQNPHVFLTVSNGKIVLNVEWAPVFGMPPLKLENNELSGLPSNWDFNHSANAIEVVNERLVPIFQFYYKDDTHLVFNGVITSAATTAKHNGVAFISETHYSVETMMDFSKNDFFKRIEALNLKTIFKYPAWKYPGEYAD